MKNGGFIGIENITTNTSASGIFDLAEQKSLKEDDIWPNPILLSTNVFNLVGDPLDIFAWNNQFVKSNCTITRDTSVTDSPYGGVPMKMNATGSDPHIQSWNVPTANITSASGGDSWTLKALVKAESTTTGEFYAFGADSSGIGYSGGSFYSLHNLQFDIGTEWQEKTLIFTLADDLAISFVQFRVDGNQDGSNVSIWWDGFQLYKNS